MRFFRPKDQTARDQIAKDGQPAAAEGWKERIKGVVQGSAFRFEPLAPGIDRLEKPALLKELPDSPFPEQTLRSRVRRFIAGKHADRHSREQLLHWRFYDIVDQVLGLVSPEPYQASAGFGFGRSPGEAVPSPGIRHPYQIKSACEFLGELPEAFAAERRYLDELLSLTLFAYRTEISRRTIGSMSFFHEAQDYLISGYKLEKSILKGADREAKISACQQIYDSYHHGINYYIYALLTREPFDSQNSVFMFFCNALHFKARIEWNGNLLDRAIAKKLPSRNWVLFYALRDRTVLRQYQADGAYARQFKELLQAFPEDASPNAGGKHKPAARSAKLDPLVRPGAQPRAKGKVRADAQAQEA